MNNNASLNENKNVVKIKFEEFPNSNKKKVRKNKEKKDIHIFLVIIIAAIVLSFLSSFLNIKIINGNYMNYRLYNTFDGNYANIELSKRDKLFKKIGFIEYKREVIKKDLINYDTSYAYNLINKEKQIYDYIIVYYDKYSNVKFVELNLNYDENEFYINRIYNNCYSLINNFVKKDLNKNIIMNAKENLNKQYEQSDVVYLIKNDKTESNFSVNIKVSVDK